MDFHGPEVKLSKIQEEKNRVGILEDINVSSAGTETCEGKLGNVILQKLKD